MVEVLQPLQFTAENYKEMAGMAEQVDREPEVFITGSLRFGLYLSDIAIQTSPVKPIAVFQLRPDYTENRIVMFDRLDRNLLTRRTPPPDEDLVTIDVGSDLLADVTARAAHHSVPRDEFIDCSLEFGWLWEQSAGIGYQVRVQNKLGKLELMPPPRLSDDYTPALSR